MGDTPDTIAVKIAGSATGERGWSPEAIEVQAKGNCVIVRCGDLLHGVVFSAEIEGKGTLKIETEEI